MYELHLNISNSFGMFVHVNGFSQAISYLRKQTVNCPIKDEK